MLTRQMLAPRSLEGLTDRPRMHTHTLTVDSPASAGSDSWGTAGAEPTRRLARPRDRPDQMGGSRDEWARNRGALTRRQRAVRERAGEYGALLRRAAR